MTEAATSANAGSGATRAKERTRAQDRASELANVQEAQEAVWEQAIAQLREELRERQVSGDGGELLITARH